MTSDSKNSKDVDDYDDWSRKIELITCIIKREKDVDHLLWEICGAVLDMFSVDRAWLLFPCDPTSPSWTVPIERTVAEYPGANIGGFSLAMTKDVARIFQTALDSESPVIYGPGGLPLVENTKSFKVKSQLSMAIYPRVGKPWQFGIHQCTYDRVWKVSEIKLFNIIGVMAAEALGNLLLLHDLQEANENLEQRIEVRTAELNAEKNLAESLIDTAQAIVLVLDTEGRIQRINPYMEELSGYQLSDVKHSDWFSTFLPQMEHERVRSIFRSSLRRIQVKGNVNPILTKAGEIRQIEWYAKALTGSEGEILGVLSIGHDITERIEAEQELQRAKSLAERANSAKSRFLAAASHDLRQPLQALSLLLSALSSKRINESEEQIIDDMRSALHVTTALLNALLDISKLEAHYFIPDKVDFPVAGFLQDLRNQFKPQSAEKGVRIRLFPSNAVLHTDIGLLSRIVQNFISNAIYHGGGDRILIGCRRAGVCWRIEVWDRGPGIVEENLEAIFEEFFQLGNSSRDLNRGLGLGLAIAKRVAELLGLNLNVRSRPGRGSVFSVEVPGGGKPTSEAPTDCDAVTLDLLKAGKILVIDDDRMVLKATEMLLNQWGYHTFGVSSADEAIDLVSSGRTAFSLFLIDYRLPDDWNGVKLHREIEAIHGRELPAILLTGDTSTDKLKEVRESGLPILHKPVDTTKLLQLINKKLASPD